MGAMSADDIRLAEGLNPLAKGKGGDLYVVQGQYVPLGKVGETPAFPKQPPPKAEKGGRAPRFNPNHDEKGQFAESGGAGGGKSFDETADIAGSVMDQVIAEGSIGQHDKTLAVLAQKLGFDAKPTKISASQFAEEVPAAETLYRSVESLEQVEQFKEGPYFAGTGNFGSGIYFAKGDAGREVAKGYGSEATMIKAGLKQGSKVIDHDKLQDQYRAFQKDLSGRINEENFDKVLAVSNAFSQPNNFAMLRGYDAVRVANAERGSDFVIVLNRGAVVIPSDQ